MKYSICQQIEITLVEGKNTNILYSNESKKKLLQKKMVERRVEKMEKDCRENQLRFRGFLFFLKIL